MLVNTCQILPIIEQVIRIKIEKIDFKTQPHETTISNKGPRVYPNRQGVHQYIPVTPI